MYTLYKFHFLNGISEINQLFDDILIIWPAPVYIYIYYIYIRAVKMNALTQTQFNGTNFINMQINLCLFSVWPVA